MPKKKDRSQPSSKGGAKYKITVGITKEALDRLHEIRSLTDRDSAAAIVRDALRVYDILTKELIEKGGELTLKSKDGQVIKLKLT